MTSSLHAAQYDQLDAGVAAEAFGIPQLRESLIGAAYGQVLEVAIGMFCRQHAQCHAACFASTILVCYRLNTTGNTTTLVSGLATNHANRAQSWQTSAHSSVSDMITSLLVSVVP